MLKADKIKVVDEIKGLLENTDGFILADFKGVNVSDFTELRAKVREAGGSTRVVKNRLLKIALADLKVEGIDQYLKENTVVIYAQEDIIASLKVLADFVKKNDAMELKAGLVSGDAYNKELILQMSKMPGRKELIGMIAGGLNAVISKFAGSLDAIITKFVGTIEAVENSGKVVGAKEAKTEAPAEEVKAVEEAKTEAPAEEVKAVEEAKTEAPAEEVKAVEKEAKTEAPAEEAKS